MGPPQLHGEAIDLDLRELTESSSQASMRAPSGGGASGPDHLPGEHEAWNHNQGMPLVLEVFYT